MPVPLARWAFTNNSRGTSTVILRAVSMVFYFTISDTSIEYGIEGLRKAFGVFTPVTR